MRELEETEPSIEEWGEWLRQPMTQRFVGLLVKMREETQENWAAGIYTSKEESGTIQANSEAIGRAGLLGLLIRMQSDDYRDAEEHFRTQTSGA